MDALRQFLKPELVWFLTGILLLILELLLPGLIVCFFAAGAIVVAIVCLLADVSLNTQLLIFIVVSVSSLLLLRRWLKGVFLGHVLATQNGRLNIEEFVGQRAIVKEKILPKVGGKVEFHGTDWVAIADQEIAEGAVVEIIDKDNLTLRVKAV